MNVTEWGLSIVLDFFWGGMAVGAFLFSVFFRKKNNQLSRIAAYISPLCLFVAMFFLVTHLGQPLSSIWVFLSFNFSSVIAWGSLLQGIFLIITISYAFTVYKNSKTLNDSEDETTAQKSRVRETKLGFVGVPFAVLIGIYQGYLLMSLSGRPLWNSGLMPILSIGAFITTGVALVILVSKFSTNSSVKDPELTNPFKILMATIIIQFFTVLMWLSSLWFGGIEKKDAVLQLIGGNLFSFWIMALLVGLVVPIILGTKDWVNMNKSGIMKLTSPKLLASFILVGAFFLRYVIIVAG